MERERLERERLERERLERERLEQEQLKRERDKKGKVRIVWSGRGWRDWTGKGQKESGKGS